MRITDLNNIYSDVGGGVRTYHQQKLRYFERHPEHSYSMIVPGAESTTVHHPGGRVHYVKGFAVEAKDSGPGYYMMYDVMQILRAFELERPEIVEIGGPYTDPWFARIAKLQANPVFVGFYHLEFRDAHIEPLIARWPALARRATMSFFDWALRFMYQDTMQATFVGSEVVQRELAEIGITNTILTPLGVDTEKYDSGRRDETVRRSWGAQPGDRVLFHAGRLCVEKGTRTILDAADRLLEDPTVHIVMAGRGGLARESEAKAKAHPRFHHLGFVSDPDDLGAAFASADAYLATGPYETFGLSVLEALASGIPVIATDEGAGTELALRSGAGLVFKAQDPTALVEKTRELLTMDLVAMGKVARRFAEEHGSWQRTFDLMYDHYQRLIEEQHQGANRL
jgi:alpha-1,6-mannosyltransferase